jgi:hypothetical protein
MKTVSEAFQIARRIRLDQVELVAGDGFERRVRALCLANQQAGHLIRHVQQPLGDADIDHQHARRELRLDAQRRQQHAAAGGRRGAFAQLEIAQRFRRHQHFSRRRHEGLQACASDRGRVADFAGQRDRLDTQ